jgi:hypothetical protein
VFTTLPLKETASFKLSFEAVTGCVPFINDFSSHFPDVVYLTFPTPMHPGNRPNHSWIALVFIFGTRSKLL